MDDPIVRHRPNETWLHSIAWNFVIVNEQRTNNAGWASRIDYVREADTPLLAFVGDSFVEANQLPWPETCHGRLSTRLEGQVRVYSFGHGSAPLSQYLGYAEHVRDTYRPAALVIPIIENDFDQSFRNLLKSTRHHMFFAFDEQPDGELVLVRPALPPSESPFERMGRWLRNNSSLLRYRFHHVRAQLLPSWDVFLGGDPTGARRESAFSPTAPAGEHPEVVKLAYRATDAFLRMLPERSGLDPDRIVFVVDGLRPRHYTEDWKHEFDGSYYDVVRRYFMKQARAGGFEVIDMQPVFVDHYRSHQQAFNWVRDKHWNSVGHGLCAEQVGRSAAVRRIRSATTARETN